MDTPIQNCPLEQSEIIDLYFLEHRAKLLDIAAFLDRMDRAQNLSPGKKDYRMKSIEKSLQVLMDGQTKRVARILDIFSDQTAAPSKSAAGVKAASGAWPGFED
jgi:hypothetical protein